MGDLHLVLPSLNLCIPDAGILIMVQQVSLMMLSSSGPGPRSGPKGPRTKDPELYSEVGQLVLLEHGGIPHVLPLPLKSHVLNVILSAILNVILNAEINETCLDSLSGQEKLWWWWVVADQI